MIDDQQCSPIGIFHAGSVISMCNNCIIVYVHAASEDFSFNESCCILSVSNIEYRQLAKIEVMQCNEHSTQPSNLVEDSHCGLSHHI